MTVLPLDAEAVLTREQLKVRAKLIEIAAIFDRIDRAEGSVDDDVRMTEIRESIAILSEESHRGARAERIQMIYSREFDPNWQQNLELTKD